MSMPRYSAEADSLYVLANSMVFRRPSPIGVHAIHVPFLLLPLKFSRDQIWKAYSQLYLNIASVQPPNLIRKVLGMLIAKVDGFVGSL
ncbi:hypothetical protein PtB15_1B908 [Puccinia triticina]|nr:hypothetical protein PtB15_1B908 [Puccinia triticina]